MARVTFKDSVLPVEVALEASAPFPLWKPTIPVSREGQLHFTLSVRAGSLVCRDSALSKLGTGASQSSATIGKTKLRHQVQRGAAEIVVTFPEDVNLAEGDQLVLLL